MLIHEERGSTLIETLMSILLIILLLHLTLPILVNSVPPRNHLAEVIFFLHQLENEAQQSKKIYGDHNVLYLVNDHNRTIKISLYGSLIRRQVNDQGHEVLLRDVDDFNVTIEQEKTILIIVTLRNGDQYEKNLAYQP